MGDWWIGRFGMGFSVTFIKLLRALRVSVVQLYLKPFAVGRGVALGLREVFFDDLPFGIGRDNNNDFGRHEDFLEGNQNAVPGRNRVP